MKIIAAHEHQPSPEGLKVIELPNDANPFELVLAGVDRIDLQFPKFTDGRAFSEARLRRGRLKFAGERRRHRRRADRPAGADGPLRL